MPTAVEFAVELALIIDVSEAAIESVFGHPRPQFQLPELFTQAQTPNSSDKLTDVLTTVGSGGGSNFALSGSAGTPGLSTMTLDPIHPSFAFETPRMPTTAGFMSLVPFGQH